MTMQLGSQTIVLGKTGYFDAPSTGLKGLIITNESPYTLSVIAGIGQTKTLNPETQDFFSTSEGFNGNVTYMPSGILTNPTSYTATTITFDAVGAGENIDLSAFPVALTRQAVTATASGDPLFTASFTATGAISGGQHLSIYNPVNSGVVATIHSAKVFTTDTNTPTANLIYTNGDQNLSISVPAVCHSGLVGRTGIPVSVMHCTAQDLAGSFFVDIQTVETENIPPNVPVDMPIFPDNVTLPPGTGLILELSGTAQSKTIRLKLKWTEKTFTPPQIVQGLIAVASIVKNDGNVAATQWVEVTPSGQASSAVLGTVDGQLTWKVVQSGVYHQVIRIQSSGNPLQIGQAGDVMETLGQLLVDQLATFTGNIVANGGMNINTIRDDVTGTAQITLTTAGISILNALQAALKFKTIGQINAGYQMIGDTTIANAGTSVSHSLGVTPTVIIPVLDAGAAGSADVIKINFGTASSTTFTAYSTNAGGTGNVRFFVMA